LQLFVGYRYSSARATPVAANKRTLIPRRLKIDPARKGLGLNPIKHEQCNEIKHVHRDQTRA